MPNRAARLLCVLTVVSTSALAQHGLLLVAQKGDQSLGIVDPVSGKVLASVPEGGNTGHEVTVSPDGRFAYVPIYGNSGVGKPGTNGTNMVVIDLAARKVVGNIDFGHGVRPHLPVFGPKDGLLYVSTELDKTISIIDPKTLKIVGSIPTGQEQSHMFVISHDGRRAYTANVGPGTVSVLDMAARKTLKVISISANTQRISISPDDHYVFTADQTSPRMAVIDTATDTVKTWIPLASQGYGSTATADGRWLLVALEKTNQVAKIDLAAMRVAQNIDVCADPQEVVVNPDGKTAYVSCMAAGKVAEFDLGTGKVTREFATGKTSDGLAWAGR
ncbi:MAG TPA: cytochrome D1 domain-containing protein [Terracidiphilus sp.]|jgi:YVTN family beta-propeller protein